MAGHADKTFDDLNRREINLRHYKIEEVLPDHIIAASFPKLVTLLTKYYKFEEEEISPTTLLNELFLIKDITQTDIDLLSFVEDELLLGQSYFEGFADKREALQSTLILCIVLKVLSTLFNSSSERSLTLIPISFTLRRMCLR